MTTVRLKEGWRGVVSRVSAREKEKGDSLFIKVAKEAKEIELQEFSKVA